MQQGLVKSVSCRGCVWKRRRPRPINRHTVTKAVGYWGPRCSALALWVRLEAKSECALGPGATVGVLGTGVPRLACLRPAAWLKWWPSTTHLHQLKLKTLTRGQASRGGRCKASSGAASPGMLARRRRDHGKGTSRGARDASHDDRDEAGTRWAPPCAVSLFPLWCKGGKRRRGVSRHQAKVTISVQRDQDQQSGRMEVIVEPRTASPLESLAVEDQL